MKNCHLHEPPKDNSAHLVGCERFARSSGKLARRILENEIQEYNIHMISKDRRESPACSAENIAHSALDAPPSTELQPPVFQKASFDSKTGKGFKV
ncbi:hypothetical protein AVEN_14336-1 [Araneus ventricosus]|uniref:Uncharacterized protein n=1 Tax=Araneus ventricosus TaxID=182803 RepID=A0A4Y2W3H8_ARAVE|nr:hypothetical protein AVEN_14336-1 [Araneus ventricosus]